MYCQECWWGDQWDPLITGRDFNFSRTFSEQYAELRNAVPRLAVMNKAAENSEYCNYAAYNKNCYLAVGGSWYNEGCLHGTYYSHSKDSVDCYGLLNGELCYEIMWGEELYSCMFCADCFSSSDCYFSSNLRGCKNCILCTNLRNKEYYIRNQPSTKEEFDALRRSITSNRAVRRMADECNQSRSRSIRPSSININCENCTGDYLRNCRNVFESFEVTEIEDGKFLYRCEESKDLMDCGATGYNGSELFYETINSGDGGKNNLFSFNNWACSDVLYCDTPQSSRHCFGCISLKRKQYCILNKQYTKEEYEELVPKIIEHMRNDGSGGAMNPSASGASGSWGEFFPVSISPFAYNETVAQEYFPLTKQEIEKRGWKWREEKDEMPNVAKVIPAERLPDSIDDIPDDILNWAITCEATKRPFRIIRQELEFYRKMRLPVPRLHPDERHRRRMALRNPRKLWDRPCMKCGREMQTIYAPDRPEIVYCEACYLAAVY